MKDPQLQYAWLQDLGCTSIRDPGYVATGSGGSGMHGCRIWDAQPQDAGPQGPGDVAAGCRMHSPGIQDVQLRAVGCWAAGGRACTRRIRDATG